MASSTIYIYTLLLCFSVATATATVARTQEANAICQLLDSTLDGDVTTQNESDYQTRRTENW